MKGEVNILERVSSAISSRYILRMYPLSAKVLMMYKEIKINVPYDKIYELNSISSPAKFDNELDDLITRYWINLIKSDKDDIPQHILDNIMKFSDLEILVYDIIKELYKFDKISRTVNSLYPSYRGSVGISFVADDFDLLIRARIEARIKKSPKYFINYLNKLVIDKWIDEVRR